MKRYFAPKGFKVESLNIKSKTDGNVVCKFCGAPGLSWVFDPQQARYRLYDSYGRWHNCRSSYNNPQR